MTDDNTPSGYTAGSSTPDHNGHLHDGSRWTGGELRRRADAAADYGDLDAYEALIFWALDSYANGAPECYASQATLRRHGRCSSARLNKSLARLEAVGLIERVPGAGIKGNGGTTTLYRVLDIPCESSTEGTTPGEVPRHAETRVDKSKDLPLTADQQGDGSTRSPLVSAARGTSPRGVPSSGPISRHETAHPGGHVPDQEARREEARQRGARSNRPPGARGAAGPVPRHDDAPRMSRDELRRQAEKERAARADAAIRRAAERIEKRKRERAS